MMASSKPQNSPKSEHSPPSKFPNQPSSKPLTATASYTTKAFGYARVILGAASLLFPHFTCGLFQLPISNETATIVRLFGVRGIALGELLLAAGDETLVDGGRREIRKLLRANLGCDVTDIFSIAFAVAGGHMDWLPGALLAGGAATLVGVALLGLKTV